MKVLDGRNLFTKIRKGAKVLNLKKFGLFAGFMLLLLAVMTACGEVTPTATTQPTPAQTVPQTTAPAATVQATPTQAATTAAITSATTQAVTLATMPATSLATTSPAIERKSFTVNLEGFESKAELTYPTQGKAPFATVVMFPGAGFWDMDTTYMTATGARSANFKQTAEFLAEKGFAVVRFNKRGIKGFNDYDQSVFQKNTIKSYTEDGGRVLDALKQFEQINLKKIYLYGWSEGTIVAGNLALQHPEVAGLIIQAGPAEGYKTLFTYQQMEIGIPYATKFDSDKDGALSVDEIMSGFSKGAGNGLSSLAQYFFDATSSYAKPVLSKQTDKNGDGKLDIEKELKPAVQSMIDNFEMLAAASPDYMGFDKKMSTVPQALIKAQKPALILQGENDGFVSAKDAKNIAETVKAAGNNQLTLKLYPGLGHSLSKVASPGDDSFGSQELAPLQDLAGWLAIVSK